MLKGYLFTVPMAMLDVAAAAEYGLQAKYLSDLFGKNISLGNVQVDFTYYNSCAYKNTWGDCQGQNETRQRDQPAQFDSNSAIQGSGKTVSGSSWLSNTADPSFQAHLVLQNANSGNPAKMTGVVMQDGNRKRGNTEPVNLWIKKDNFKPGGITFISDGANATVGTGQVTTSSDQLASGASASNTFTFVPGGNPVFQLSYTSTNSVQQSTTQGTTNSSSSGGSAGSTVGLTIGNSATASAGLEFGPVSAGGEVTSSVEASVETSYQNTWDNVRSVDFSQTTDKKTEQVSTVTITIDLNNIQQKPDGTYNYDSPSVQIDGQNQQGGPNVPTVNFVPGKRYKASIVYNRSNVETVVTGQYTIAGTVGYITDSYGNITALSAAEAIASADAHQGPAVLNYPSGSLGNVYAGGTKIPFQGSAIFGTSLQSSFYTNFYSVSDPSSSLVSSSIAESNALKNKTKTTSFYDLGLVDHNYLETGVGNWLSLTTLDGEKSVIDGGKTGGNNVVEASYQGTHEFINHSKSFIIGNKYKDKVVLDTGYADNNIDLKEGDDKVIASEGQTADLGSGNDTYVINEGKGHQITLGEGRDVVKITSIKDEDAFHITDFDWVEDQIKLSGNLNNKDLKAKLVNKGDLTNLDGARLDLYYKDTVIGTASIAHGTESYYALSDAGKYFDIKFLNSKFFDFEHIFDYLGGAPLPNQAELFEKQVVGNGLFHKRTISPSDWTELSVKKRATIIDDVMEKLGGKTGISYWTRILNTAGDLATNNFDTAMVANHIWPHSNLSLGELGS